MTNYELLDESSLTVVNNRFLLTEVREGGEFRDAILLGEPLVVDLDEIDAKRVGVIVYLLQLLEYLVTCDAASGICNEDVS